MNHDAAVPAVQNRASILDSRREVRDRQDRIYTNLDYDQNVVEENSGFLSQ
jgi:hypothetical protein